MPKPTFADYKDEIRYQREAWARKPALRRLYHAWYAEVVAALGPLRPVVELGSGCGNFKAFFPACIATDALRVGDWIQAQVDARRMPFRAGSVGNFVLVDVLHHVARPLACLRSVTAALAPGGRIVLFEPAATPWGRFVYGLFHHERLDLGQDFLAEDGTPAPADPGFTYANMATASALFARRPDETLARLPGMALVDLRWSDVLAYPLTGGFGYANYLTPGLVTLLRGAEGLAARGPLARLAGMRLRVVLERRG
ncbi:MAG: methyltransferase domain-containing protein [Planctomycetes bacterium]|nr:methyltransferase domain-containing protein [Planctomycetota bacterium]